MTKGRPLNHDDIEAVLRALKETGGNKRQAAKILGLARSALYERLEAAPDIPPPEPPSEFAIEHAPQVGATGRWEILSTKDNRYRFAAMGDLHAASKYCRWDVRTDMTRKAEQFKAQAILDTGNWIDGEAGFNRYDLVAVGLEPQLQCLAQNYPETTIPTYAVTGADHEGWYIKREGIDVGRNCESVMREAGHEWTNLGYLEADIILRNANSGKSAILRLQHPGGGSAYAYSYKPQKILESLEGGEKPDVLLLGHYHKLDSGLIRGVWYCQTGCFDGRAYVKAETGYKRISAIAVGDLVWTHKNRLRPVSSVNVKNYVGTAYEITAGPTGAKKRGRIAATGEHPFLTLRGWVPACRLNNEDWVAVESRTAADGTLVPHYRKFSDSEFYLSGPRKLPKLTKHNQELERYLSTLPSHFRIVPLHRVTPDAIAIDWDTRRILSVEMERNRHGPSNPKKYDLVKGLYDDIIWVCTAREGKRKRHGYKIVDGNVFVPIRRIRKLSWNRKVFTLGVDEDNTFICGRFVVHNCQQDQTPFLRTRSIEAHIGGVLLELEQDPEDGSINGFKPDMRRYFNRAYYIREGQANQRWSGHGPIKQVPRKANIKE